MGINASPTCVMAYDDAVGYLIGEPNQGMRYMFTMMNNARLSVGLEGLALGERAYQQAVAYAAERRQGRAPGRDRRSSAIIDHADVRRMLLTMKAHIEALRVPRLPQRRVPSTSPRPTRTRPCATPAPGAGRHPHADHQGLGHRPRRRADLARRPGPRRDGLHRGDRRRPALPRHPHRPDLRGHQRHPGDGPRRPQARPARRRGDRRATSTASPPRPTRRRLPAASSPSIGERAGRGARRRCARTTQWLLTNARPTPTTPSPGPRRTCEMPASSPAAGCSTARSPPPRCAGRRRRVHRRVPRPEAGHGPLLRHPDPPPGRRAGPGCHRRRRPTCSQLSSDAGPIGPASKDTTPVSPGAARRSPSRGG